jgi:DNA mismatch repair ATPase MutS
MDKKQTALEWLIGQLQQTRDYQRVINEANESSSSVRDVIKQAKEMEKQKSINDFVAGNKLEFYDGTEKECAEQYYNKTYGGNR